MTIPFLLKFLAVFVYHGHEKVMENPAVLGVADVKPVQPFQPQKKGAPLSHELFTDFYP